MVVFKFFVYFTHHAGLLYALSSLFKIFAKPTNSY